MKADTTVTFWRTNSSDQEEYAATLPIRDLDEFFISMDWYEDFINRDFLTIGMTGTFDFLLYEETVDIELFNSLLLRFQQLNEEEQETVLYLTHLYDDTICALHYALSVYSRYTIVPSSCKSEEAIAKFVIEKIYPRTLLRYFEESISFEDFFQCLFKYQIAFCIDDRYIIKSVELTD